MGELPGDAIDARPDRAWRSRYLRLAGRVARLAGLHHNQMRQWLDRDQS